MMTNKLYWQTRLDGLRHFGYGPETMKPVSYTHLFMLGYVPTGSMEPTLKAGSMILGLRCFDEPQKGDIVVFRHEDSYLSLIHI